MYINNLPKRINSLLELILIANNTSILITTRNFEDFFSVSNLVLSCMIEWFKANKLVLTLGKTNIIKPVTLNSSIYTLTTGYKDKYTEETVYTHFVLQLNSHLNWKDHIGQMIPKLSAACYTVRLMFHISNIITLKSVYFAYFHFIIQYGIIEWGEGEFFQHLEDIYFTKRKSSALWVLHILEPL